MYLLVSRGFAAVGRVGRASRCGPVEAGDARGFPGGTCLVRSRTAVACKLCPGDMPSTHQRPTLLPSLPSPADGSGSEQYGMCRCVQAGVLAQFCKMLPVRTDFLVEQL